MVVTFDVSPSDAHIAQYLVATSLVNAGNGGGGSTALKALKVHTRRKQEPLWWLRCVREFPFTSFAE